jgi:hypothetical protein
MEIMTNSMIEKYSSGCVPAYGYGPVRHLMRVPDEIRKCVFFLQRKTPTGLQFAGTGLFIGTPIPGIPGQYLSHMVTARHIIDQIAKTPEPYVYIRVNFPHSGAESIPTHVKDWYVHPSDDSIDLAVARSPQGISKGKREADHLAYQIDRLATASVIESEAIGIGDEVFIAGLFGYHPGSTKNIPIIRVGHIAAMPEEPIETNFTDNMGCEKGMEAYLIEARSMKGLSGSPAFVHLGVVRSHQDGDRDYQRIGGEFYLLGLVVGHYQQKIPDADVIAIDEVEGRNVNVGLALVAPATKILETLNHPKLKESREKAEKRHRAQFVAVSD